MKNIMVTGGCGFMGSHFVELLLSKEVYNVIIVDKLSYAGNRKNIFESLTSPRCRFYLMDIAQPEIAHVMKHEQIDTVVNFAAETHVDRSITHPRAFLETDILGLFNLAYHSIKNKVECFLQISTDEVYGPMLDREADESYPLNPTSPYSASKASAELLLQSYYKTYKLPLMIVRCCNNFGPRQYPEKLIPMAITRLLDDKPVLLHGEGKEIREWIYVEDCVKGILSVLEKGKVGEVYNIGSGCRLHNSMVVMRILWEIKCRGGAGLYVWPSDQYTEKYIQLVTPRPNNDFRYAINSSKFMEKLLGSRWKYFYTHEFTDDLRETIQWYKDNLNWWEGTIDLDSNFYKEGESLR